MRYRHHDDVRPFFALWTTRLSFFALALVVAAFFLHRLFSAPTPFAINLVLVAAGIAVVSLFFAFVAAYRVWVYGGRGTSRVVAGGGLAALLLGWPVVLLPTFHKLPMINDVTTDTQNPPPFVKIANARARDANPVNYPADKFADLQVDAYPDIRPLVVNRSAEDAFGIVGQAVRRLRYDILREVPPDATSGGIGLIEAADRTLIMGFYDDVAFRVTGNARSSRIDIRSASRYGKHDLGRNATRIRAIIEEIVARLEASVPTVAESVGKRPKKR